MIVQIYDCHSRLALCDRVADDRLFHSSDVHWMVVYAI